MQATAEAAIFTWLGRYHFIETDQWSVFIDGGNHNPAVNAAMQGYAGFMWRF
jgi:hypothetical protein